MKFTLIVEIDDADIDSFVADSPSANKTDVLNSISNTMYLGLSCIDGMLNRQFDIDNVESYLEKG
jgi:hypothetical protein